VITKHGKPVARLVPVCWRPTSLFGYMKNTVKIKGDIVAPIDHSGGNVGRRGHSSPGRVRSPARAASARRNEHTDTHIWLWYAEV
jgi:antitoxin (DNA-binding transcriptional repressor) of toxin-antitoxin stability system